MKVKDLKEYLAGISGDAEVVITTQLEYDDPVQPPGVTPPLSVMVVKITGGWEIVLTTFDGQPSKVIGVGYDRNEVRSLVMAFRQAAGWLADRQRGNRDA